MLRLFKDLVLLVCETGMSPLSLDVLSIEFMFIRAEHSVWYVVIKRELLLMLSLL